MVSCHFSIVPSEPLNVTVSRAIGRPTELYVTWDVPTVPNGEITAYTVYCAETIIVNENSGGLLPFSGSGSQSGSGLDLGSASDLGSTSGMQPMEPELNYTIQVIVPGNWSDVYVQDLTPFREYECFVTANTAIGEGDSSIAYTAVTDESCKWNN